MKRIAVVTQTREILDGFMKGAQVIKEIECRTLEEASRYHKLYEVHPPDGIPYRVVKTQIKTKDVPEGEA